MTPLTVDDDTAWEPWRQQWQLRPDTIYLNHGSFGPPPEPVRHAQRTWKERMDRQPMDFFVRTLPSAWHAARQRLATFVGTAPGNLVFVENATQAMNIVAHSLPLAGEDEVLLTDHEYGAVKRIWERRTKQTGAICREVRLPIPFESAESIVDGIMAQVEDRTRLIVISQITSPTAVMMPVGPICREARRRGVRVCVDGPHALAQLDLSIDALTCDYYAASCHKWLSAPFGSGFLYVAPEYQSEITPPQLSWGVLAPAKPQRWDDEFQWLGTRDPSPYLAVPAAIEFLEQVGLDNFRRRTHWLAQYARRRLSMLSNDQPIVPDSDAWYGSMAHMPLPAGNAQELQEELWRRFGIEVPIVTWNGRRWVRVSCHLYNRMSDIDALVAALRELL